MSDVRGWARVSSNHPVRRSHRLLALSHTAVMCLFRCLFRFVCVPTATVRVVWGGVVFPLSENQREIASDLVGQQGNTKKQEKQKKDRIKVKDNTRKILKEVDSWH